MMNEFQLRNAKENGLMLKLKLHYCGLDVEN